MLRRALNRNLHEEPVVPTPPESVALRQQLFEVSDGLNYRPPALGHRDRLGGRETLKVHQTDDSCEIDSIIDVTTVKSSILACCSSSVGPGETMDEDRLTSVDDVIDELQHRSEDHIF